jgi:hypothetical protein
MVDLGLHTGGIQPQLAPLCHLGLPGQLDYAVVERMQRFGLQRIGPTDQCGIIGRWFPEQATEPAQHQALVHPIFGLLITPSVQVLEQQQTQQDFHRRGMASMHQGVPMPFAKVVAHLVVHLVIVEQLIQLLQHRVDPFGHLRHARKDIFFGVAIDQHAQTPPCAYFLFYPYSTTLPALFSHGHLSLPGSYGLKPLLRPHFAPHTSTRETFLSRILQLFILFVGF